MEKKYKISEFAHLVGLSPYTLRYYENEKLITPTAMIMVSVTTLTMIFVG
ncbi:MerR family DNA-binding transcriptional regulator [Lactobacillus acetotolerans]